MKKCNIFLNILDINQLILIYTIFKAQLTIDIQPLLNSDNNVIGMAKHSTSKAYHFFRKPID